MGTTSHSCSVPFLVNCVCLCVSSTSETVLRLNCAVVKGLMSRDALVVMCVYVVESIHVCAQLCPPEMAAGNMYSYVFLLKNDYIDDDTSTEVRISQIKRQLL